RGPPRAGGAAPSAPELPGRGRREREPRRGVAADPAHRERHRRDAEDERDQRVAEERAGLGALPRGVRGRVLVARRDAVLAQTLDGGAQRGLVEGGWVDDESGLVRREV